MKYGNEIKIKLNTTQSTSSEEELGTEESSWFKEEDETEYKTI